MEKHLTIFELLGITLAFGSIAYLLGIITQIIVVVKLNKPWTWGKLSLLLLATKVVSIILTLVIWVYWFLPFDSIQGPILLPALISEVIAVPTLLKFFKQSIFKKPTAFI